MGGSLSLYIVCGWGGWTKHDSVYNSRGGFSVDRCDDDVLLLLPCTLFQTFAELFIHHPSSSTEGNANSMCSCRYSILIGIKIIFINFFVCCNIATKMGMDFILWMVLLYLWADKLLLYCCCCSWWMTWRAVIVHNFTWCDWELKCCGVEWRCNDDSWIERMKREISTHRGMLFASGIIY